MLKKLILKWLGLSTVSKDELGQMIDQTFQKYLSDDNGNLQVPHSEITMRYFRRHLQAEVDRLATKMFQHKLAEINNEEWIDALIARIKRKQL